MLTIIAVQLVNLFGAAARDCALYADRHSDDQYGESLDDVSIDGCLKATLDNKQKKKGQN